MLVTTATVTIMAAAAVKQEWNPHDKAFLTDSPYVKAMEWTLTDPLASSWMDDDDDAAKFDQRFGMALFYFQMGGDSWTKCSQNETALLQNVTSKNCTAQESSTQNCCTLYDRDEVVMKGNTWLSENHECQWGGIICEGDVVSGLHLSKFPEVFPGLNHRVACDLYYLTHRLLLNTCTGVVLNRQSKAARHHSFLNIKIHSTEGTDPYEQQDKWTHPH